MTGEVAGWPFLAGPTQRWLSDRLQRDVRFVDDAGGGPGFTLRFVPRLRIHVPALQIADADWRPASAGPMLTAHGARLEWRYGDLIGGARAGTLHLARLSAASLALRLDRREDGRANWQFANAPPAAPAPDRPAPRWEDLPVTVDHLSLGSGRLTWTDAPLALSLEATLATADDALDGRAGWVAQAHGRYHGHPVSGALRTGATGLDLAPSARTDGVPAAFSAQVGQGAIGFAGRIADPRSDGGLRGLYWLSGPSMAAVGLPFGVTLPTTATFAMRGSATASEGRWQVQVDQARIGRSTLGGRFTYRRQSDGTPLLTGRIDGPSLWLQDLGPAIGDAPAPERQPADRVLPAREFNLPTLTAMDADVRIALDRLALGHPRLQSLAPVRGRLRLQDGRLEVTDLDARAAQGRVGGRLWLDGRQRDARWGAQLKVSGLRLEQWIRQPRADDAPPYASGHLSAHLDLQGHGRSTAALLASTDGAGWVVWSDGRISHLALEWAGVDVAQALGLMLVGDDALPVGCGAAELRVRDGVVRPTMMVVDTPDSTVWVDGGVSLATERLALTAHVEPKDFSPLSLRAPIHVEGTLGNPAVRVDGGGIVRKLVPAALLAAVAPLAALLPLVDAGDDDARPALESCRRLVARRGGGR